MPVRMFLLPRLSRALVILLLLAGLSLVPAKAADLPLAQSSPLSGITFEDQPLQLPVQQNFQMALLTASGELGRSCGKMEAYGWRMKQNEQGRVDQIFNNTVDSLRGLGYSVETQSPASVSRDVTLFTADRQDRHFIFMWSAGEIGLVMVLCESSPSLNNHSAKGLPGQTSSVKSFPLPAEVLSTDLKTPVRDKATHEAVMHFSPVGKWVGSYVCAQGYTGGTLTISSLSGKNFKGEFRFYPTPKNPHVPGGSYNVFGQYDHESYRILVNPGKWIKRPRGFANTIIVGEFDPAAKSFSGFFQGIVGCTSFEAKLSGPSHELASGKPAVKKKTKKKHVAKKKAAPTSTPAEIPAAAAPGAPIGGAPSPGISVGAPQPVTTGAPPPAPSTVVPQPAPALQPPVPMQTAPPMPASTLPSPAAAPQPATQSPPTGK